MNGFPSALEVWRSGGALLIPLAAVSYVIFALIFRSVFSIRPLIRAAGKLRDALESCNADPDAVRNCLLQEINGLGRAYLQLLGEKPSAQTLMERMSRMEEGYLKLQSRDLLLLNAFTAAAPLLGLLGTVAGMITTFNATASFDGNTGQQIAEGISRALITTQFGLVIALPGVFGISHLQKRLRDLETRLNQCRFMISGAFSRAAAHVPADKT